MGEYQGAGSIAIYDDEFSYAGHMADYIRQNTEIPYEIALYSDRERLLSLQVPERTILLVIAESEYTADVVEAGYPQVLILQESDRMPDAAGPACVSKYQSMDAIADAILSMCLREDPASPAHLRHCGPMHIIAFYTPLRRALQTTTALTAGQILARHCRTMYLNYEYYSGLRARLGRTFRGSLSELVYYNDCARDKLPSRLSMMTENVGGLLVVPPAGSYQELQSVSMAQWIALLTSIEQMTDTEYLILDLSEVDGLFDILRHSSRIVTITRTDPVSEAKMADYEALVRREGCEDILTSTMRLQLPVFNRLPADMTNLAHGPLAEFIGPMIGNL